MAVKTPESVGHSRRWYFTLAAIAAGGQATALVVLSVLQFARFEHAEGRRYVPDALDQFVRTLSAPLLLFYPPEWVFWLRTYGVDERWLVPLFVAMNALLWGVALAGVTWWWQRSLPRRRLLGLAAAFGVIGLVLLVAQTRAIYCHGDFSGILHCHLFFTPDHDH